MRASGVMLAVLTLSACAVQSPSVLNGLSDYGNVSTLPGWNNVDASGALSSFVKSCKVLMRMPPDTKLGGSGEVYARAGQAGLWDPACQAAKVVPLGSEASARQFFDNWFEVYQASGTATFTGYFEPEVRGSKNERPGYTVPLYAKPAVASLASLTRTEIDDGGLYRQTPVTAYVASQIDAYMLQVQAAGRIVLPDGRVLSVGFDGDNGQPYTAIGSVLVRMRALPADNLNYQSISNWLRANPAQARAVMEQNENYVYLRPLGYLPSDEGPPGALGVALTARHSVAVDRNALPLGAPLYVATTDPQSNTALDLLTVAQDTGAGLSGADEVDIFFGSGLQAEQIAGAMQQPGTVYLLLPRQAAAAP